MFINIKFVVSVIMSTTSYLIKIGRKTTIFWLILVRNHVQLYIEHTVRFIVALFIDNLDVELYGSLH